MDIYVNTPTLWKLEVRRGVEQNYKYETKKGQNQHYVGRVENNKTNKAQVSHFYSTAS